MNYLNWLMLIALVAIVLLLFESLKTLSDIRLAVQLIHDSLNSGRIIDELLGIESAVRSVDSALSALSDDLSASRRRVPDDV